MVDKNTQFYAILTNVGAAKQANADALGIAWKITQMGVGDAKGTDPTPNATQKALINEWRRAPLNQLKVDDNDPSIIVAEQVIPADIGGMWIREIGLYDEDGDLVAVANCAPTYKPVLSQGSGRTQVLRMSLVVSSAANVQLKIDPSVVLATREWVTEELSRQDFKHSVLVATTANISLSGQQTIDGVALAAGARVLVKNQAAAKENGIYTVVSGAAWKRSTDADSSAKVTPGLLVLVESGTLNGDSAWQLVTDAPIALGVTALSFEMAFGRTGVNAGTYKSVQVDKYGRVVAATNPTTVGGYGITDVYTKSETYNRSEIAKAIADSVTSAVNGLVDSAPGALDTLKELATAIGNDPNFATTMVNELAKKAPLLSPKFSGTPETPTPAASSTGLQVANMSALATAVAASARQFKTAVIGVSTNLTLTAAQMGNAVQFNTGPLTLALPSLADVGNGASVMLRNPSATATQTVVVASSGSIVDGGSTIGQMPLKPFEWAELASSGTAWFVVGRGKLKEVAELDSPVFTGTPEVPTAPVGSTTKQAANMVAVLAALQAFGLGTTIGITIADFDGVTETGLYRAEGSAKSSPFPNASMALLHIQFNQTGCFQLAASCSSNIGNGRLFWRTKAGGAWSDWQQVGRLDSPAFTGSPTAPNQDPADTSNALATMASTRNMLARFGVGSTEGGKGLPDNMAGLASMPSGNYYYPSAISPYPEYAFVQRMTYGGNRGFEIGNIPYKDRFFGRASNQDGSWRDPIELAPLDSPSLTGTPRVPTAPAGSNTTQAASTAFVAALAALKADLASPALTGTPTAPTAPKGTKTAQIANTAFVQDAIAALINASPAALDTLSELATALGNDPNFSTTMVNELAKKAALASPAFTGNPTAPTAPVGDNDTSLANTAFVQAAMGLFGIGSANPANEAVSDIASLTKGGLYMYAVKTPGAPTEAAGALLHLPRDSRPTQIAADYVARKLFVRYATGTGTYTGWTTFAMLESPSFTGEVSVKGGNVLRYINDAESYGLLNRVDNGSFYMLLTDNGNPNGSFNALRPFQLDFATGLLRFACGATVAAPTDDDNSTRAVNSAWVKKKVDMAAPVGQVAHFALSSPPSGWLKRNGAAVSRTTYAALFAVIGTQFGAGDGSTTFNLPDDRELIDRAWTDGLNAADAGRALFSAQAGQIESHAHGGITSTAGAHVHNMSVPRDLVNGDYGGSGAMSKDAVLGDEVEEGYQTLTTGTGGAHNHTLIISATGGNETRMANRAYLACIKY
ncbi:phage tail-collar fiber domain-containing protein [Pseudomonas parafulva]|uniref:phage tail-collar fiber domain-containing protein n=1 Tax=Pseudomonas parafulva TaxID=157782 RepID=UPI0003F92AC7|nr:phage tail protein [Pseudomonas parafulva]